jgi:uncharacterized protein YoxC
MFDGTLATTNLLLGILTTVTVVAAIALVVALVVIVRLTRHAGDLVRDLRQQLSTLSERIDGVGQSMESTMADIQRLTKKAATSAERAQFAFDTVTGVATLALTTGRRSFATRVTRLAGFARAVNGVFRIVAGRSRRRQSHEPVSHTHTMEEVALGTS